MAKFINAVKNRFKKEPVQTVFMGTVILLAALTLFKPESAQGLVSFTTLSLLQVITIILLVLIFLRLRKK